MHTINSRYYRKEKQASPQSFFDKVLPEMSETLSDLILRRMKDVGISSKSELARQVGISPTYAGDLINNTGKTKKGTYSPSFEIISKLAEVLKIGTDEIIDALMGNNSKVTDTVKIEGIADIQLKNVKLTNKGKEQMKIAMRMAIEMAEKE